MERPLDAELIRRAWSALTVRVAWELVRGGVQVRPATLRAARDHAAWRLGGVRDLAEVEARASRATEEFLARAEGRWGHLDDDEDLAHPVPHRWSLAVLAALEAEHEAVYRLHYADGYAVEDVATRIGLDVVEVRAARDAIRDVARDVVAQEHPDARSWDAARIDRWVTRIANATDGSCPGVGGMLTDAGRVHAERCPRCSKTLRLVREGMIALTDLSPPEETGVLPIGELDVACILVHPDARRHVRTLARALGSTAKVSVAGDELLVHAAACPELESLLIDAAEQASPERGQLRAVRMTVPGRWTRAAPIGPGLVRVRARAAALAWGETEGLPPLPAPLPPPPSLARWWVGAGLALLLAVVLGTWTLTSDAPGPGQMALTAEAQPGAVQFDTDDLAWVYVVATSPGGANAVFTSARAADKGDIATGDGGFRVEGAADRWIVVASPTKVDDFVTVLTAGPVGESASAIADRLTARWPTANVRVVDAIAGEAVATEAAAPLTVTAPTQEEIAAASAALATPPAPSEAAPADGANAPAAAEKASDAPKPEDVKASTDAKKPEDAKADAAPKKATDAKRTPDPKKGATLKQAASAPRKRDAPKKAGAAKKTDAPKKPAKAEDANRKKAEEARKR